MFSNPEPETLNLKQDIVSKNIINTGRKCLK